MSLISFLSGTLEARKDMRMQRMDFAVAQGIILPYIHFSQPPPPLTLSLS
jgi:hypothetical protein